MTVEVGKLKPRTREGAVDALHRARSVTRPDGVGEKGSLTTSVTNASLFFLRKLGQHEGLLGLGNGALLVDLTE